MPEPSVPTIKRLFAVAGNQCAFPACTIPLVETTTGEILAEVCHIKGRRGKRYDQKQTEDARHAFENLILLCGVHHKIIDGPKSNYTVEQLVEMKITHERGVAPVAEPTDAVVAAILARHLALHSELVEANRASLELLQRQVHDQRIERAGPVIAYIEDQLRTVQRWLAWSNDSSFLGAILGDQPGVLLPRSRVALEQAPRVSPKAYQDLAAAVQRMKMFDGTVYEVRRSYRRELAPYQWNNNADSYFSSIRSAREFLEEAEQFLLKAKELLET